MTKVRKKRTIGETKVVQDIKLQRIGHQIIPLRNQTPRWIVGVPLVPFVAPLDIPPPVEVPSYLLYDIDYLTSPRDQGVCGSCWAFSICDVLSDRLRVQTNGGINAVLSPQELLNCYDRQGCEGSSPEGASLGLERTQFGLGNTKYRQRKRTQVYEECKENIFEQVRVRPGSVKSIVHFIEEKNPNPTLLQINIASMRRHLFLHGPIYAAMTVYDDLFIYRGERPYRPNKNAYFVGGHAVEIIGYAEKGTDSREGYDVDYWICKNTWGDKWPTRSLTPGYFTIIAGENICGIESRCGVLEPEIYPSILLPKGNIDLRVMD